MSSMNNPLRSHAVAKPWPDRWLADAATRRGVPGSDRLLEFGDRPTAWEALVAAGASESAVLELACLVSATKPADLSRVGPADAMLMSQKLAEKHAVVPVRTDGPTIVVAASNPLGSTLERDLAVATGHRIDIVTASPADIAEAQRRVYPGSMPSLAASPTVNAVPGIVLVNPPAAAPVATPQPRRSLAMTSSMTRDLTDDVDAQRTQVTTLVDQLFSEALRENASDVHFEPKADGLLVRFRVDGGLYDARRISAEQSAQVVRRLKIIAGIDIADSMRPQDGRATISHEGRSIDLRVSTLPLGGAMQKVVVRILDSRIAERDLDVIGFSTKELMRVKRLLELPEGLILVAGPTGSGKTSTLYAALRHVHRDDLNIVTVEDPIEYRIEGINQVQVNEKTRMTFAASLRSILRQDPDVVLVGEMRDAETASIAVKASMTGHLVLSTLHASDALSTLDRLYGMDMDTGALAAAIKGIVAQRLVRRLCPSCAAGVTLSDLPLHQQQLLSGRQTTLLRKPVGCSECRGTGYQGRTIVAEIFLITPSIQRAIARRADVGELSDLARQCGTITMWESGLERVLDGTTSLYELLDNVAAPLAEVEADSSQADVDALLAQLLAAPGSSPPARQALPVFEDAAPPVDVGIDEAPDIVMSPVEREASPAGTAPRASSRSRGAPLKVLIVDDDRAQRRVLADALFREGLAVIEAADGESALSYARHLHPDVIVTEVALPRLDAVGLLQGLAGEGIRSRVIVYTGQRDTDLHAWLTELGAEDVVSRSVDARALATRLRGKVVSIA